MSSDYKNRVIQAKNNRCHTGERLNIKMAEGQDRSNSVQEGLIPEEKMPEVVCQDEFGEIDGGNMQSSQGQQQDQGAAGSIQAGENSNNVRQEAADSNQMQSSLRARNANQGDLSGGGRGSGNYGIGRGRGGLARGRGGYSNNRGGQQEMMGGYGRDQRQYGGFNVGPYGDT